MNEEMKKESNHSIAEDVIKFTRNLEGLKQSFPLLTLFLNASHITWAKLYNDYVQNKMITEEDEKGETIQMFEADVYKKFKKIERNATNTAFARKIILRNFLIALASQFDVFIGRLMRNIFLMKPEVLNSSEKTLTFSKLSEYSTIEEAREFIIEKEIESVLRESHVQQFKWFENKLGDISLKSDLPSWKDFIELTERRNLFVHTDGIISTQYINICKSQGCELDEKTTIGDQLEVNEKYFENAYKTIVDIGVRLSQVIWRKLRPNENNEADDNIIEVVYDLLLKSEFELAAIVSEFATHKVIKHKSLENQMICVINKAQSYKWMGDNEKCKNIISNIDWSAYSDKFKLAFFVLDDKYDKAYEVIRKIGKEDDEITQDAFIEWPLFRKIRKEDSFKQLFEEMYGEPLVEIDYEKQLLEEFIEQNKKGGSKKEEQPTTKAKPAILPKRQNGV